MSHCKQHKTTFNNPPFANHSVECYTSGIILQASEACTRKVGEQHVQAIVTVAAEKLSRLYCSVSLKHACFRAGLVDVNVFKIDGWVLVPATCWPATAVPLHALLWLLLHQFEVQA